MDQSSSVLAVIVQVEAAVLIFALGGPSVLLSLSISAERQRVIRRNGLLINRTLYLLVVCGVVLFAVSVYLMLRPTSGFKEIATEVLAAGLFLHVLSVLVWWQRKAKHLSTCDLIERIGLLAKGVAVRMNEVPEDRIQDLVLLANEGSQQNNKAEAIRWLGVIGLAVQSQNTYQGSTLVPVINAILEICKVKGAEIGRPQAIAAYSAFSRVSDGLRNRSFQGSADARVLKQASSEIALQVASSPIEEVTLVWVRLVGDDPRILVQMSERAVSNRRFITAMSLLSKLKRLSFDSTEFGPAVACLIGAGAHWAQIGLAGESRYQEILADLERAIGDSSIQLTHWAAEYFMAAGLVRQANMIMTARRCLEV